VINGGRLSRPLVTGEATLEEIGLLMGGLHDLPDAVPAIESEAVAAHG